jgi:uncharacterized protein YqjF (DUF2071 family)
MANYEIEPGILKKYLPAKTELDTWNNKHYVSLVGFMFLNTKLKGISIPFHSNFPEVNLRFYVKHKAGNDWKRGVVFINEFVPKPAITFVANSLFKEKYVTYPMRHKWEITDKNSIGYYWKKNNKWNRLEVTASLNSYELKSGSKEEFITEHYWGYSSIDQKKTNEYQVEHPRWNIYPVGNHTIDCNFAELYGNEFECLNKSQPASIFLAEGSPVSIYSKKTL